MTINVFGCFKSKAVQEVAPAAEAVAQRALVPVAAVAKKVGSTEEPGARLCPSPPLDLAMLSKLSFHAAQVGHGQGSGRIAAKPRAVRHVRKAASLTADDYGAKPIPEEPASLDPRLLADAIGKRIGTASPREMSLLLSPRRKGSARKTMSLVLSRSDQEVLNAQAGLNSSCTPPQIQSGTDSKRLGRKVPV
eukprot:evm.model.scf_356.4 EVM.evm.TU.scf_356.4   scf_356:63061-65980(-)